MNPARQKDKRANPVSRGRYGDKGHGKGMIPIVIHSNGDPLSGYEFLKTCQSRPSPDGAQGLLLQLWTEGVEGYLRDENEDDKEDREWVEDGNIGESEICTFNWIAMNLLVCDPDKIREQLVVMRQKKIRKLYKQIGFRQWTPEGKKAGFRRE